MLLRTTIIVITGVFAGIAICLWTSRFVAPLLYGVGPRDPSTLIVGAAVLIGVGALAAWLPARRATRIDPAVVLRSE